VSFFDGFLQNNYNGNLIIMDIELKYEDGFQVIRKISVFGKLKTMHCGT